MQSCLRSNTLRLPTQRTAAVPVVPGVRVCRLLPCRAAVTPGAPSTTTNGAAPVPAQPITVNIPEMPPPAMLTPAANYAYVVKAGAAKASQPAWKIFWLGLAAGAYIALGGFFALSVGNLIPGVYAAHPGLGKLLFALVFPMGLTAVLLCGAELYTGNTAVCTAAALEGAVGWGDVLKNWIASWTGNLVASVALAVAVAATGILPAGSMPVSVATAKCSHTFAVAVLKAFLCNWFVCIAVWQASAANTIPGKMMALWPPIAAFTTIGLEHSVANMFMIPLGMFLGAKVTWADIFLKNLLPVTLGNTLAGVLCLGLFYSVAYGKLGKGKQ